VFAKSNVRIITVSSVSFEPTNPRVAPLSIFCSRERVTWPGFRPHDLRNVKNEKRKCERFPIRGHSIPPSHNLLLILRILFLSFLLYLFIMSSTSSTPSSLYMRRNKQTSWAVEMRLMMTYFAAFDGTSTWDDIEPIVDATFHPKLQVHGHEAAVVGGPSPQNNRGRSGNNAASTVLDIVAFKSKLRAFVEAGGWMEIHKLKQQPLGIHYHLTFHKPDRNDNNNDMTFTTKSFGTFQDGKLVRVQRDNVRQAHAIL